MNRGPGFKSVWIPTVSRSFQHIYIDVAAYKGRFQGLCVPRVIVNVMVCSRSGMIYYCYRVCNPRGTVDDRFVRIKGNSGALIDHQGPCDNPPVWSIILYQTPTRKHVRSSFLVVVIRVIGFMREYDKNMLEMFGLVLVMVIVLCEARLYIPHILCFSSITGRYTLTVRFALILN